MLSLRELQTDFMGALLGGELTAPSALLAAGCTAPARRLQIYRNNVQANFIDSLHSSFPALWRLVGEDYFRQVAREYHKSHPSRSGDLLHVGAAFPGFLAELHRADAYRYLGDVARFEWRCQEALLAAEHAPLDFERLRGVPPAQYEALRFRLSPALRLFDSPFPILRIWEVNVASDAEPELIDLASGADCLAIVRQRLELKFYRLSPGEKCFLDALQSGAACGAAIESSSACEEEFDAGAALRRFVLAEAIVDFT